VKRPPHAVPIDSLPGVSKLFRDYCARSDSPLHGLLGGSHLDARAWDRTLAGRPRVDPRLVARLQEFNAGLGAPAALLDRIARLGDGTARAVVTGQQPGVLGGPLLALYKAASSVALARTIEQQRGTPCVPVFWLGADDDDFAEIRELVVIGPDRSVTASVGADSYRPRLRVGDIARRRPETWKAAAPSRTGRRSAGRRRGESAPISPGSPPDRGWVTQARSGARRTRADSARVCGGHAADFWTPKTGSRPSTRASGSKAWGTTLARSGGDSGLFLLREGTRHRIPMDRRRAARAEFEADITRVSPGVVARNLLQDAVLAPAAAVLGPAEVADRAQLADVYRELRVPTPVAVPRLMATFVPAPVREVIDATGVDPSLLATDALAFFNGRGFGEGRGVRGGGGAFRSSRSQRGRAVRLSRESAWTNGRGRGSRSDWTISPSASRKCSGVRSSRTVAALARAGRTSSGWRTCSCATADRRNGTCRS
jgi:hypothetical protein